MNPKALLKKYSSLVLQKLTPVKPKRFLFTSFDGHYSDSPKYISQKIHALDPSIQQVWLVKEPYRKELPDYVTVADMDDPKAVQYYRSTAKVIVDNVYGGKATTLNKQGWLYRLQFYVESFLKHKPGQRVFTTWHGTPLKCMGRDQIGSAIRDFSCPDTTMLMGNQYTLEIMRHLTFGKVNMALLGTPRNDLLFADEGQQRFLREALGLPVDKKILLFAPTFRSDGDGVSQQNIHRSGLDQLAAMDFDQLLAVLNCRFGGEWVLVCRFHYHVEAMVDWAGLAAQYPGQIINGNLHDDMAQYLFCADALLTDASSSMYDFALTGRPCFLFFPDLDHYANQERGFYTPIRELPFSVAESFETLAEQIAGFDEGTYLQALARMRQQYGYVDDADASERVANYIFANI